MSSIKLENVCLDYILNTGTNSLKKTILHTGSQLFRKNNTYLNTLKNSSYRALSDINLKINHGDRLGLLGVNGAGKSTLLRLLAKIYKPTHGNIVVEGNISNLFDVNLGMNIEATGYENIINLAVMRGISKKVARSIIDDVESFTELGQFLAQPVRTYSSGMQMKLAFAVATAIPPEIMLIDEVIGAGDSHFMEKATKRLENVISQSHILVLTSHSNDIIKRFCNKALVLKNTNIAYNGELELGIAYYQNGL